MKIKVRVMVTKAWICSPSSKYNKSGPCELPSKCLQNIVISVTNL